MSYFYMYDGGQYTCVFGINNTRLCTGGSCATKWTSTICSDREVTFTAENSCLDSEFIKSLAEAPTNEPYTLQYEANLTIPARSHKKKRIRKKWLRRYGMKKAAKETVCCEGDFSFAKPEEFEFVVNPERMMRYRV